MKKIRFIIPLCLIIAFMVLAFLPQNSIIGGREFISDLMIKLIIAVLLIFIYISTRFYKKGIQQIIVNALFIPFITTLIVFLIGLFIVKNIYGNALTLILPVLAYGTYYITYIKELHNK